MKRYILLIIVVLCGCSDFLDTNNLTEKDSSSFPVNEEDIMSALTSVYSMNTYVSSGSQWQNVMLLSECMADYTLSGGGLNDRHVRALSEYKQSGENSSRSADPFSG